LSVFALFKTGNMNTLGAIVKVAVVVSSLYFRAAGATTYYYEVDAEVENLSEDSMERLTADAVKILEVIDDYAEGYDVVGPGEAFEQKDPDRKRRSLLRRVRASGATGDRELAVSTCPKYCRKPRYYRKCVKIGCAWNPPELPIQRVLESSEPLTQEEIEDIVAAMQDMIDDGRYCEGREGCDIKIFLDEFTPSE